MSWVTAGDGECWEQRSGLGGDAEGSLGIPRVTPCVQNPPNIVTATRLPSASRSLARPSSRDPWKPAPGAGVGAAADLAEAVRVRLPRSLTAALMSSLRVTQSRNLTVGPGFQTTGGARENTYRAVYTLSLSPLWVHSTLAAHQHSHYLRFETGERGLGEAGRGWGPDLKQRSTHQTPHLPDFQPRSPIIHSLQSVENVSLSHCLLIRDEDALGQNLNQGHNHASLCLLGSAGPALGQSPLVTCFLSDLSSLSVL